MKLPDFTTRKVEYDIATAQFSPLPVLSFFFFHIRVRLSQREDHFITPRKQSVGLFIPYRYNLQQRGYSTLMNDTCIMRGICLDINLAGAGSLLSPVSHFSFFLLSYPRSPVTAGHRSAALRWPGTAARSFNCPLSIATLNSKKGNSLQLHHTTV